MGIERVSNCILWVRWLITMHATIVHFSSKICSMKCSNFFLSSFWFGYWLKVLLTFILRIVLACAARERETFLLLSDHSPLHTKTSCLTVMNWLIEIEIYLKNLISRFFISLDNLMGKKIKWLCLYMSHWKESHIA